MLEKLKRVNYRIKSLILYGIALFCPIFIGSSTLGFHALILGWLGVFAMDPFIGLPYIANILYFINLIFFRKKLNIGIQISYWTIVLALFSIGIREIPVDEGGQYEDVFVGIGFVLWILSFLVLLMGQIRERKQKNVG